MQSFKDNADPPRRWLVAVNVYNIGLVRAELGIDLYKLHEDGLKPLGALVDDPVQMVAVLYYLCKKEIDQRGLAEEEFGCLMDGDVYWAAREAFLQALADFYPPNLREALRDVYRKGRAVQELATGKAAKALEAVDPEAILAGLEKAAGLAISSGRAGNSPASSGLTPTP